MAERQGEEFDRMNKIKIEVDEFTAEYAGCGSHRILLRMEMSDESVAVWHDRLTRIIEGRKSIEEERLEQEAKLAQEQRDRGLLA